MISYRSSKLNAVLQGAHKVRIRQLDDMEVVSFLQVLDPLIGLSLWINHQRPSSCITVRDQRNIIRFRERYSVMSQVQLTR